MYITYKVSCQDNLKQLTQDCLDSKLYHDNGLLKGIYQFALNSKPTKQHSFIRQKKKYKMPYYFCVVAYENENPIGVVYISGFYINFYVKEEYRRRGIGTELYRILVCHLPITPFYHINISRLDDLEAVGFLDKMKIALDYVPRRIQIPEAITKLYNP